MGDVDTNHSPIVQLSPGRMTVQVVILSFRTHGIAVLVHCKTPQVAVHTREKEEEFPLHL